MPDEKGKLTELDQGKIAQWFNLRGITKPCPSCGTSKWEIAAQLLTPLPFGNSIIIGGPPTPMLIRVCANCGLLFPYSAVMMGLVPAAEEGRSDAK